MDRVLLHCLQLVDVDVAVLRQLLQQAGETESKVIDVLPRPEGQVIPLLVQLLHDRLAGTVDADATRR